jgi:multiple sugar transport system substrate-binding protein
MTPITTLDRMSQSDVIGHCPLAYSYSNYSRPGFRQHLCLYADMPGVEEPYTRGSHLGGTGIAISRRCRHLEVAADYAARVAGAEWQSTIYCDAGGQPAYAVAWSDEHVNESCHDFFRATRRTIDAAYVRPRYDGYIPVQYEVGAVLTEFLAGRRNHIRETLREINRIYAASRSN